MRDAFSAQTNVLSYGLSARASSTPCLLHTPIDPVPYDEPGAVVKTPFMVPRWQFQVWRSPNDNAGATIVI